MYTLMVILHVLNCLVLCVVVLLQASKGGGLAGAFGGGGAPQQIFGTRGMTTMLHKITIYCAVAFFVTSTLLFGLTARRGGTGGSIVQEAVNEGTLTPDVTPEAPIDESLFRGLPTEGETPATETGGEAAPSGDEGGGSTSDEGTEGSGQ
jgi:preprotein translocase subunit SecG